jgi:hypothetical protein
MAGRQVHGRPPVSFSLFIQKTKAEKGFGRFKGKRGREACRYPGKFFVIMQSSTAL